MPWFGRPDSMRREGQLTVEMNHSVEHAETTLHRWQRVSSPDVRTHANNASLSVLARRVCAHLLPVLAESPSVVLIDVTVLAVPQAPLWVAVAASTAVDDPTFDGPFSSPAGPLFQQCSGPARMETGGQYLATQHISRVAANENINGAWHNVLCESCPLGAVCRGLPWEAIIPAPGFAVAEWDPLGMTFLPCVRAESCPKRSHPPVPAAALTYLCEGMYCGAFEHSRRALQTPSLPASRADRQGWAMPPQPLPAAFVHGEWTPQTPLDEDLGGANSTVGDGAHSVVSPAWQHGTQCSRGYAGRLCAACLAGFTRAAGDTCVQCPSAAQMWFAALGGVALGIVVLCYLIKTALDGGGENNNKPYVALNKLLFTHLQQIAIASTFPMQWPAALRNMFAVFDASTSVSDTLFSVDCFQWGSSSFVATAYMQMLLPWIVLGCICTFWTLRLCFIRQGSRFSAHDHRSGVLDLQPAGAVPANPPLHQRVRATSPPSSRCTDATMSSNPLIRGGTANALAKPMPLTRHEALAAPESGTPPRPSGTASIGDGPAAAAGGGAPGAPAHRQLHTGGAPHAGTRIAGAKKRFRRAGHSNLANVAESAVTESTRSSMVVSVLVACFLLHLGLSKAALSLITCTELAPGRRFLAGDVNVPCSGSQWSHMQGIGITGALLYGAGIPAIGGGLLWSHRRTLQSEDTRRTYGFLYITYSPGRWYWETIIALRKVLLATVAVLLQPQGVGVQSTAALLLLMGCLFAHERCQPYATPLVNAAESGSLLVMLCTLAAGGALVDTATSDSIKETLTVTILMLNACFLCVICALLVLNMSRDSSLRRKVHAMLQHAQRTGTIICAHCSHCCNRPRRSQLPEHAQRTEYTDSPSQYESVGHASRISPGHGRVSVLTAASAAGQTAAAAPHDENTPPRAQHSNLPKQKHMVAIDSPLAMSSRWHQHSKRNMLPQPPSSRLARTQAAAAGKPKA